MPHVIIYFNGLGLPFRNEKVDPQDRFHWLNRVWTLQEHYNTIIIGGLAQKLGAIGLRDFSVGWPRSMDWNFLSSLMQLPVFVKLVALEKVCEAVRGRYYSNPIDQIASLAYALTNELPIYDADLPVTVAWAMLIENMAPDTRAMLLFTDFGPANQSGSWQPTWEEFINCNKFGLVAPDKDTILHFLEGSSPSLGNGREIDAYYHRPRVIHGVRFHEPRSGKGYPGCAAITIASRGHDRLPYMLKMDLGEWGGSSIAMGVDYVLITDSTMESWIAGTVVGTRQVDGERAIEVAKVAAFRTVHATPDSDSIAYFARNQLVVWR